MSFDSNPKSLQPASEWNRYLTATYSADSTSRFVEAAFGFLRTTVSCDLLLFHNIAGGDEFPVLRDSEDNLRNPTHTRAAFAFSPDAFYADANPRTRLIPTRGLLPENEEELARSPIYTDVMKPLGMRHSVSILFWGARPSRFPESAFSVFRSPGRSDFSDSDLAALETARLHIETAMDCLKARVAGHSKHDGLAAIVRNLPIGSILLNWHLDIIHANRAGVRNCVAWLHGDATENMKIRRKDFWVPAEIESACHELQREWTAALQRPRSNFRKTRRIGHPTQPGLRASVSILCHRGAIMDRPSFLIQIEQRDLPRFAVAPWKRPGLLDLLTVSEREVALKAVDGLSNQEIASLLGKTVCAIKFLLHSTYEKLEVSNRTRLVALLHDMAPRPAVNAVRVSPRLRVRIGRVEPEAALLPRV